MRKRKKNRFGEQVKTLQEWAEERLCDDEYSRFINYSQFSEGKDLYDMLSDTEFSELKEKFELEG